MSGFFKHSPNSRRIQYWALPAVVFLFVAIAVLYHLSGGNRPSLPVPQPIDALDSFSEKANERELRLKVYSNPRRLPIAAASIKWKGSNTGAEISILTDAAGLAVIPVTGPEHGVLRVIAEGHVARSGSTTLKPGTKTVGLRPMGAFQILAKSDRGTTVEDVEIELLSPLEAPQGFRGELPEESGSYVGRSMGSRRSGTDGIVRWSELLPAEGYRWKVLSDHLTSPSGPNQDSRRVEFVGKAIVVHGGSPDIERCHHQAGDASVDPGQVTYQELIVMADSGVRGTLQSRPDATNRLVRLFHKSEATSPGGGILTMYDEEKKAQFDLDGAFHFIAVKPGPKKLQASWKENHNRYLFATAECELAPGEFKDLGLIPASPDGTLQVLVKIEGLETLSSEALKSALSRKLILTLQNAPPPPHPSGMTITEMLDIPVGDLLSFEGLFIGNAGLSVSLVDENVLESDETVDWEMPRSLQTTIPAPTVVEFVLRARAAVPMELAVKLPDGLVSNDLVFLLIPTDDPRVVRLKGSQARTRGSGQETAFTWSKVPTGSYQILAVPVNGSRDFLATGHIVVGATGFSSGILNESPSAQISGLARDKMGQPIQDGDMFFMLDEYADSTDLFHVKTDREGKFVVRGVPPRTKLRAGAFEGTIESGDAGSRTEVLMTRNY